MSGLVDASGLLPPEIRDKPVVLFDAGGTLITLDHERIRALLVPSGVAPSDREMEAAEARARRWADARVRARIPLRELWNGYFGRILEDVGVPNADVAERVEAIWDAHHELGLWRRPIVGALDAVAALAASGRVLGVVSNAEGQVERDLAETGFAEHLRTIVDSHVVGVAKPDPRIFHIALERLGVRPSDAVYVGDVPAFDVDGAKAAGIVPILLDPHRIHALVDALRIEGVHQLPALMGE
jgi:putative hydrolase of the HAD superfamily